MRGGSVCTQASYPKVNVCLPLQNSANARREGGGGGTPLQEANRDIISFDEF